MVNLRLPHGANRGLKMMYTLVVGVSCLLLVGSSPVGAQSLVVNADCGEHGATDQNGKCACEPCWTGERCDIYAKHKPIFLQKREEVVLSPYQDYDAPIFTAEANDMDGTFACASRDDCPCAQIHYSILSGNDDANFRIDSQTGDVTVIKVAVPFVREVQTLLIEAKNPGAEESDVMELMVRVPMWDDAMGNPRPFINMYGEGYMAAPQPHHIHKRAVTLPGNVTFTLTKEGSSQNITEMRVGTRVSFKLVILFPTTGSDMLVELFAPDNDSIVMMLCDVKVQSIGGNLVKTGSGEVVLDSQNSSTVFFDRAIIDFGNVSVSGTPSTEAGASIVITWDAVMIQNDNTQDQAVYWVSAGAEYNSENEVWVGQAAFTARTNESTSFDTPIFNLTGPNTMSIGTSAIFTLHMFITQPSVFLSIDAFAPLNNTDVMSICGMQIVDTGKNYMCGFDPKSVTATLHVDDNRRGNGRARMRLGIVTNKGAREAGNPTDNNRITVQFVVHMYDNLTYIGQSYWVGAAVEIGTDQIWAGEILVTAQALVTSSSITPTWQLTKEGSGKVSTIAPLLMTLDITIPEKTIGKYALEVLAPLNDSAAVFQLCSIRIIEFGKNLPCTDTDIIPTYSSRGESDLYADRGYADFGTISNVGSWGQPFNVTNPNATDPNLLRVQFLVKATNHTLATPGSSHSITLGLFINNNRLMIGTYSVEVVAAAVIPNITNATTPDWALSWVAGNGNIAVGASGQFLMSVTTKRNTVYSPFDIEALMPNGTGSTKVAVCQVQVHSIGKNLPCLLPEPLHNSVVYTSLLGDGLNDRAVLNLPSVCNYELVNDTAEDVFVLRISFKLQPNHPDLINGTELWPSTGVMFSPYKMWVGQIKAVARTDLVTNSGTPPYVNIVKTSTTNISIGYFASYNVLIKTKPGDLVRYTINVTTATTGLSVCSVRVTKVGNNMPCTFGRLLEAWYEQDADGVNVKGSVDFGPVSNAGVGSYVADDNVDNNTLVVEVMIGLTSDTAVLAAGSSHTFDVKVVHGGASITRTSPSFTVTHDTSGINMTASNITNVTFAVAPITGADNDTNVVLGQSKRFTLCAYTYPGAVTKLSLKMLTPVDTYGVLEAAYIGFASAGKNLPCLGTPCKSDNVTYENRPGSEFVDVATVDFGYVYNNNFDTTDPEANKVCVDGVFRVLRNDTLTLPKTVPATASINVNDIEITIVRESLTVVDNSTFVDMYLDNATLVNGTIVQTNSTFVSPSIMTPGQVETFPILLSIPPYTTSLVNLDLKLDVNQSACMTFKEARLVSVGSNLRAFGKDYDFQCTPNSTMGSTQMDVVDCTFGVVTNPGMSHRCGEPQPEDNMIYVEIDLQMADCFAADNGTTFTASFGLQVAPYIAILKFPVRVLRDGSETPIYNITALANSTTTGDTMYVSYDVRLDNTSSAEVHNSTMYLYPTPYVSCKTLEESSGTNIPVPIVTAEPMRTIIKIGNLYFTDAVTLLMKCTANTSYAVPEGVNGYFTVLPHELSGDVTPRPIAPLAPTTVWSDMDFVNFTSTTTTASGISCTSTVLNMASSSVVRDCQITSSPDSLTGCLNGRKSGSGWQPFVRTGRLSTQRYFQVYWGNKVLVDRVEVYHTSTSKATEIELAYSDDGISFVKGDTIALNSTLSTQIVSVPSPQESRVLRVYVTKDNNPGQIVGLKFEFYGCEITSDVSDKCAAAPQMPTTDILYHRRTFLEITSPVALVYVCDGTVGNKGVEQRCYSSTDGSVWKEMDTRLGAMVGHDQEINRVYALANDGVTYMSSDDNGLTWASTHTDVHAASKAKAVGVYSQAKGVPQVDKTTLPEGNPLPIHKGTLWGASFDGLKKDESGVWKQKIKWDCC